ncbi:hypothetical protein [Coxiella-like endosymbiont]|uniref:hypothetical protein n=1 Tax=Coxiella-like endosymbiont TaxID=1592897 RepID=UPI00272C2E80|nr:hypothetical protein [Coxiella-like endosymbiont]
MDHHPLIVVLAIAVLASCFLFYTNTTSELVAPEEESRSFIYSNPNAPQYANIDDIETYSDDYAQILTSFT